MNLRNLVAFTAIFMIFLAVILRTTIPLFFTALIISVLFLSYLLRPQVKIEVKVCADKNEWFQNEKIILPLRIKNAGKGCVLTLGISPMEIFDAQLTPSVIILKHGEEKTVRLTLSARIPARLKKFELVVYSSDPLGFYTFENKYEITTDMRILPHLEDVRKAKLKPVHTRGLVGNVISHVRGTGMEFHSLRDYHMGDQMKVIHWKASAKYSRLISKQFNVERSGDVIICVDLRKSAYIVGDREKIQTRMISAAFSLVTKVVNNRDRVGAVVISDSVRFLMPGYGKKQIYRILELLTLYRGGDDVPVENVGFILPRLFRTNALFVVFTPLLDEDLPRVLIEVASKGFKIVCISPDPLDYMQASGKNEMVIVRGSIGLKRKSLIAMISKHMEIINWKKDVAMSAVLRGVRTYRERVSL